MTFLRALAVSLAMAALPMAAAADMMKTGATVDLGPLVISHGFSRATLPNAPVGGGFFTVQNTGKTDDRLIGAASDVAGHMEVHEMSMDGNVMKMRQLKDGLPIPAGKTVELKPGGYHVMFMDLKKPLKEGDTVNVTLTFEKAGKVEVPLVVGAPNAGAGGGMGGMGGMKMDSGSSGALMPAPGLPLTPALPDAASAPVAG